jgi:hypothetical protein
MVSTSFTIDGPVAVLVLSETHTEIACISGNNDGSISVSNREDGQEDTNMRYLRTVQPRSAYQPLRSIQV